MKGIFRFLDVYKQPITLPIESEYKYSSVSGSFMSVVTFLIFTCHFYLESYEVFKREHPNVFTNKNTIHISNDPSLVISNKTLSFFINIRPYFERENLLSYFNIISNYHTFGQYNQEDLVFNECTSEDITRLSKLLTNLTMPIGINLCPQISFTLPANSFKNFDLNFSFRKCNDEKIGCKQDIELYKRLTAGELKMSTELFFINAQEEMLNSEHPFSFELIGKGINTLGKALSFELEGSEVTTQSIFWYEGYKESHLKIAKYSSEEAAYYELFSYQIKFNANDINFHRRTYKTLSTSFANAYSLFKFYSWFFAVILSNYYSFNINNIINKNFDYKNSINKVDTNNYINTKRLKQTITSINYISESDSSQFSSTKSNKQLTTGDASLTLSLIYRKVSCCRVILCDTKNTTRIFYKKVSKIIREYLSVEQLLFDLIEFSRVRDALIEKECLISFEKHEKLVIELDCKGFNEPVEVCEGKKYSMNSYIEKLVIK
jgi:hypothetical protein